MSFFRRAEDGFETALRYLNNHRIAEGSVIIVQKARRTKPREPTPGEYRGPAKGDYHHVSCL